MSTTSAVARPASIKLYYGQLNFWRAECIRIGLFVGGVPFEDIRDKQRPELNAAGLLPFGATPVLEVRALSLSSLTQLAQQRFFRPDGASMAVTQRLQVWRTAQ